MMDGELQGDQVSAGLFTSSSSSCSSFMLSSLSCPSALASFLFFFHSYILFNKALASARVGGAAAGFALSGAKSGEVGATLVEVCTERAVAAADAQAVRRCDQGGGLVQRRLWRSERSMG